VLTDGHAQVAVEGLEGDLDGIPGGRRPGSTLVAGLLTFGVNAVITTRGWPASWPGMAGCGLTFSTLVGMEEDTFDGPR
jgi:hypothetical protein